MKRVGSCPSKAISRRSSLSGMEAGKRGQHDPFGLIWSQISVILKVTLLCACALS